jgi:hypothetical protein
MKKALVTIAIGEEAHYMWVNVFCSGWQKYADRHGYDIICIRDMIRDGKSPNWQKLLVAGHPDLSEYEHIVYLDIDIGISPVAPCIVDSMDGDGIGLVTWSKSMHRDPSYYQNAFQLSWSCSDLDWINGLKTFHDMYATAGAEPVDEWFNTGVMVMSPEHAPIFEEVYEQYEETEGSSKEMLPTVSHLHRNYSDKIVHLDRRFNAVWYLDMLAHYRFLVPESPDELVEKCLINEYETNYFIHFCNSWCRKHALLSAGAEEVAA